MKAIELLSWDHVIEAAEAAGMRDRIADWLETLAAVGWPGPEYIAAPHPDRPSRPPCTKSVGIRFEGESTLLAVPHQDRAGYCWLQPPLPAPIEVYRWAMSFATDGAA
ncbi:MAG: hypothetical protein ACRCW4_00425 [Candidatus Neomicrothrix subdominans]